MEGKLIIGGKSRKHGRHELDFYPTEVECTIALLDFLSIPLETSIWEPACGDGAISKVLNYRGYKVISSDLREDSGYGIGGVDFLSKRVKKEADHLITNPPFDVSYRFIHKCHEMRLPLYAMLLKSQYWHVKKHYGLFQQTRPSYVLPLLWRPRFAPNRGKSPVMEFTWTVWIEGQHNTRYIPLKKPVKTCIIQSKLFL